MLADTNSHEDEVLLAACRLGSYDEVVDMLAQGASLECKDKHERTPVMIAVMNKHVRIALFLVRQGALLTAQDLQGNSGLHLSVIYRQERVFEEMLLRHPDCSGVGALGMRLLHLIAKYGYAQFLAALAPSCPINAQDHLGRTALWWSVARRHERFTQLLLQQYHPNVDLAALDGRTPLHMAADLGDKALVNMLLTANAEVDPRDASRQTPLGTAVLRRNISVGSQLVQRGADPFLKDVHGRAPIDHMRKAPWVGIRAVFIRADRILFLGALQTLAQGLYNRARDSIFTFLPYDVHVEILSYLPKSVDRQQARLVCNRGYAVQYQRYAHYQRQQQLQAVSSAVAVLETSASSAASKDPKMLRAKL